MSKHKPLYFWSLEEAVRNNESNLWRESYNENCDCARAIEKAINGAYDYKNAHLNDCAAVSYTHLDVYKRQVTR